MLWVLNDLKETLRRLFFCTSVPGFYPSAVRRKGVPGVIYHPWTSAKRYDEVGRLGLLAVYICINDTFVDGCPTK